MTSPVTSVRPNAATSATDPAIQHEQAVQAFIGLPHNSTPDSKIDALQRALNLLGASPRLTVDGLYGGRTEAAVQELLERTMPALQRGDGIREKASKQPTVKMLQRALNVLTNAQMDVDGKFGRQTEAALSLWQRSLADNSSPAGQVNGATWNALLVALVGKLDAGEAYVPGSSSSAPSLSDGLQPPTTNGALTPAARNWPPRLSRFSNSGVNTKLPTDDPNISRYKHYYFGTERTIGLIKAVAAEYHRRTGMVLRVGDISKRGGGKIPGHGSHKYGKNIDLDLAFNDGRTTAELNRESRNASWRSSAYDRNATRTIVRLIKQCNPNAQILFNDPVLVREGLVRAFPNHDNHMHVQHLG